MQYTDFYTYILNNKRGIPSFLQVLDCYVLSFYILIYV